MKRCPKCGAVCLATYRHCPGCAQDLSLVGIEEGDPFIGTTLSGKYKMTALIGVGAMGRVYRAHHLGLDTEVAVKLLSQDMAADAQSVKRFQIEARAASRLRHPNTIQVYDFGQSETGMLFLVMELLRGRTLAELIASERLSGPRLTALFGQALAALDEAHAAGIVHRDFKPENIFVETQRTGKEHVKVLDFGIAKLRGEADTNVTSKGAVCGTPDYMSPEQIRGEELDARSDVYAAGVVLYEALTGSRPFSGGGSLIELLTAHLKEAPERPSLRRPELAIPRTLEMVCLKALEKKRDDRFRTAAEMKSAIEAATRGVSGVHCKRCGMALPESARFCLECGAEAKSGKARTTQVSLPLPLVGRESVMERLGGRNESLLLVGDAGVGKTALLEAKVRRKRERGEKVVFVGADPTGAATPYHPIRRALAQTLPATELAALEALFASDGKSSLAERRTEWTTAAMTALSDGAATFVFDDVDRYDTPSKRMIARLLEEPQTRLLLSATRPEAFDAEVEVLRLPRLSSRDLAILTLPEGVAERSDGLPLAIVDELRALDASPLPQSVLEVVVVAGGDLSASALALLCGIEDAKVLFSALVELSRRGLIANEDGRVSISSSTLRERLYAAMPAERRRALHGALATLAAPNALDPIVVGHHAERAGDPALVALIERAGDAARERFDDDSAIRWYRGTLASAHATRAGDEGLRQRVNLKLARVLRYGGDLVGAENILREALSNAQRRGRLADEVEARRGLGRVAQHWQNFEGAREQLTLAVRAALVGGDAGTVAELYLELADVLVRLGDDEAAERELWEGLLLVTAGDGPEAERGPDALWRFLYSLADLRKKHGDVARARTYLSDAARHADRVGSKTGRFRVQAFLDELQKNDARHATTQTSRVSMK